jgi:RNA polymerase sigma factor (sigma-70 family)
VSKRECIAELSVRRWVWAVGGEVAVSVKQDGKKRRSYRPTVEALEALRLLSSATQSLPDLTVERDILPTPLPLDAPASTGTDAAWDEVLTQARIADFLGPDRKTTSVDANDLQSGLAQLNRYLSRAWFRAGIAPQMHDDCSQAVYVSLLQNLGRDEFDRMVADIGHLGIKDVLNRDTAEGPDFFRAIDTVKKRTQRERTYQPLDTIDVADNPNGEDARALWRGTLQEVIDQSLTPREASLVYETLQGKTPAEIAQQWGVAPKTVSNEKTRVIQKLRDALVTDLAA